MFLREDVVYGECADLLVKNLGWRKSLVRREANSLADALAKKALMESWKWDCPAAVPLFVSTLIV